MKSLNELRDECFQISKDHGFHDGSKSFGDDMALIHSEVSEALEDFRKGRAPNEIYYTRKVVAVFANGQETKVEVLCEKDHIGAKLCGVPSEIADVIIRCLDFCGAYGIDIERVVDEKMTFNRSRPFKHGGKKI